MDFSTFGHALCIIDSGADHADLTDEYAAVPGEIKTVAAYFGREVLTQIEEKDFYAAIPALRKACGDRAVMRAIHFYQENARVPRQVAALEAGDFDTFLQLIKESGHSSYMYLQMSSPQATGSIRMLPWRWRWRSIIWPDGELTVFTAADLPEPFRPLCPLTFWMNSLRAWTRRWVQVPAMFCPSAPRAAWK